VAFTICPRPERETQFLARDGAEGLLVVMFVNCNAGVLMILAIVIVIAIAIVMVLMIILLLCHPFHPP
jgi:hypothetical protein